MTPLTIASLRSTRLALWTAATVLLLSACLAAPVHAEEAPGLTSEHLNTQTPEYLNTSTPEALNAPSPWRLQEEDELVLPLADIMPQTARTSQPPATSSPFTLPATGTIRVIHFTHWQQQGNGDIKATGGGQVIYTDDQTQKQTTVSAQEFDYSAATGQAKASGSVRLEREEGIFVGQNLNFNFQTQTGSITNAIVVGDYFTMRGKVITAQGDGTYVVETGEYTTCIRGRPDYKLRARQLIVKPGDYVLARHVILYLGGTRLISWSSYKIGLKSAHSAPVPLPGYNKTDGLFVRLHDTPIEQTHQSVDYDVRVGLKRLPIGLIGYVSDAAPPALNSPPPRIYLNTLIDPLRGILEQISPPTYTEYTESSFRDQFQARTTFDAVFQNNMGVYNRQRTDLSLTRGEVALRFINLLGNRARKKPDQAPPAQNPQERVLGDTESVLQRVPNAPFLLDANFVLSEIHEMPTNVTAGRFAFHSSLATQPLIIGKRVSLRAGLSNWFHLYTTGTAHDLTSPEVALDYVPTRTSRIGVAYRNVSTVGATPFVFDARDIRNELRLQYQVSGPWAFGVVSKIDVDRSRAYDTEIAVLRNFDCMQVGVNYRVRSQSFNIIFNLLPPTSDRARRQQLPLNPNPSPAVGLNRASTPLGPNPNAVTNVGFGDNE